jgi:hypothetical protein
VRGLTKRLAAALAALLACVASSAITAAPREGTVIQDPYYGETLFHLYQDDHFTALTHLLVARDQGRVPHHAAESELLLGGLYLHYGQHDRAEDIFERLLADTAAPAVHDRAWFYLGKVRYQRGLHEEALAAWQRVQRALPASPAAELPQLVAQSQMALGRYDAAVSMLDNWQGPEGWLAYARYNLGVALVRLGRLEDGARQLDRVGRLAAADDELPDLRDKANVALGYAWLQQSQPAAARPALARVRLAGPFATKALLGAGWADAAEGRYREALTPWLALKGRDLLDSAVQESLLAIPYAHAQLAAHGSAADGYDSALQTFDAEIARIDAAVEGAGSGIVNAMLAADDASIGRWYWQLDAVPDNVESRYLYHLVAGHGFQEGLRNVRDLRALSAHLGEWRGKLTAFEDMVAARREAYAAREPLVSASLAATNLPALRARRDALAQRLSAIGASHDVAGLATDAERDQWQRLEAIGSDSRLAAADAGALRERHRLLRGVLLWDLEREFKYRTWQQQRQLASLDRLLAQAEAGRGAAAGARADTPARLDAFAARIAAITPRIEAMQRAIARATVAEEGRLQAMAMDALQEQRERLVAYRVQAQFALATIYDRAAAAARVSAATTGATP